MIECVLEYLSKLNPRASAQIKVQNPIRQQRIYAREKVKVHLRNQKTDPTGHRFSNKKATTVPEKTRTPRSCLRWQPTGRILKTVCLRWVPTGRLFNSCTSKVESEPHMVQMIVIYHIPCMQNKTLGLSAGTSFNGQKQQRINITADALYNEKQENLRVCIKARFHGMTSDHNGQNSEFTSSNETSSSKPGSKIAMLRTTALDPVDAMHNPSQPFGFHSQKLVSFAHGDLTLSIDIHFEIVDIE
ncbi:hypothetical protein Tco_0595938 [Tanacetum coccineum]